MTDGTAPVWLHGASLGDVRALQPLVEALEDHGPRLVTAHRRTAREWAARHLHGVTVEPPPWPVPGLADRWVALRRPRLLVLEYLELWPAWVSACARHGVPVVVVDGHVGPRSLRGRTWLRGTARRLTAFAAQTPEDAAGARALGVPAERVFVHGNAKHDRFRGEPERPSADLAAAVGPVDLVVGSLARDEESSMLRALAATPLRVLVAPRHLERTASILRTARALGVRAALRSTGGDPSARWIVLDTHGELASAWSLGRVAVVGGTFGQREGQNLVEPYAHGLPVIHGPRTRNIRLEAGALAGAGLHRVESAEAAVGHAAALVLGPTATPERVDERLRRLAALQGATVRHLALLTRVLAGAERRC